MERNYAIVNQEGEFLSLSKSNENVGEGYRAIEVSQVVADELADFLDDITIKSRMNRIMFMGGQVK